MARVKLAEAVAKKLIDSSYDGYAVRLDSLNNDLSGLDTSKRYVVKVDQGIKKRGKQGLIKLSVVPDEVKNTVLELSQKGFSRFLVEPMFPHESSDERYVAFERTANGIRLSYSKHGGVDVEDNADEIEIFDDLSSTPLRSAFVDHIVKTMNREHLSFVEINPLVMSGENEVLLDAAVLADSAALGMVSWTKDDVVETRDTSEFEAAVAELDDNSPAAFSFRVLNPDGKIWLLLSGGGASITIADEAHNRGKSNLIGNYGEYSGGPTTEETYLYTKQVLGQMFGSKADKMALVIAGGVANFTDVKKTFKGIIQALDEFSDESRKRQLKVFVRRGGPNEEEGLKLMEKFLKSQKTFGSVHGSDILLTNVIHEALEYVDA